MQLIACPWCGDREEEEFSYGGQAHVPYPGDPAALDDQAWAEYVFVRRQPAGAVPRTLAPHGGLSALVQRGPGHGHAPLPRHLPARPAAAGDRMSAREWRRADGFGERVDRDRPIAFTFDGSPYTGFAGGHPGQCAAGQRGHDPGPQRRSRSSARHRGGRRRGSLLPGGHRGGRTRSRCAWRPRSSWSRGLVARGLPGQGRLSSEPDRARYDSVHLHVDVAVVGAGPAGLVAALVAARAGLRVALVDERPAPGGSLVPVPRLGHRGRGRAGRLARRDGSCSAPPPSPSTTTGCCWRCSGAPITSRASPENLPRERGSGGSAPARSSWPPEPTSGPSPWPTTTVRVCCWRGRRTSSCTGTACWSAAGSCC